MRPTQLGVGMHARRAEQRRGVADRGAVERRVGHRAGPCSEMPTISPPSAAPPPPRPIATWSPIRAWFERPAISSAAVPTAVTRPTRRWFGDPRQLGAEGGEIREHRPVSALRRSRITSFVNHRGLSPRCRTCDNAMTSSRSPAASPPTPRARQQVIAENIAHADTPGYRARDIADFARSSTSGPALQRPRTTRPGHIPFGADPRGFEPREGPPSGRRRRTATRSRSRTR